MARSESRVSKSVSRSPKVLLLLVAAAAFSGLRNADVWLLTFQSNSEPNAITAVATARATATSAATTAATKATATPTLARKTEAAERETATRRTLASVCVVSFLSIFFSRAAGAKGEWLEGRQKDPQADLWWGKGGTMSSDEMKKASESLTPLQKYVLFQGGVEDDTDDRKFAGGAPWDNTRKGVYVSTVSGTPLFSSNAKMEDAVGWPGFTAPIDSKRLLLRPDPRDKQQYPDNPLTWQTEVLDRASMTHLGHILDDSVPGKAETAGKTHYCINAASLRFIPDE
eukprot:TRINITY_DN13240_c0_g1_i1.p1 TRINITY_DN13240_c0_g1~~TRINITY_DN13240_c0_g1_i1.p1  ORF type:complete len:285 (+),score=51.87 TRINITY_DN13240_c0_g1_i1:122-976(+)